MNWVSLNLPPTWQQTAPGVPELGDEGGAWSGIRRGGGHHHRLEIMWVPTVSKWLCRYFKDEHLEALEARTFAYPHQVLEWLQMWVRKVEGLLQPE